MTEGAQDDKRGLWMTEGAQDDKRGLRMTVSMVIY